MTHSAAPSQKPRGAAPPTPNSGFRHAPLCCSAKRKFSLAKTKTNLLGKRYFVLLSTANTPCLLLPSPDWAPTAGANTDIRVPFEVPARPTICVLFSDKDKSRLLPVFHVSLAPPHQPCPSTCPSACTAIDHKKKIDQVIPPLQRLSMPNKWTPT